MVGQADQVTKLGLTHRAGGGQWVMCHIVDPQLGPQEETGITVTVFTQEGSSFITESVIELGIIKYSKVYGLFVELLPVVLHVALHSKQLITLITVHEAKVSTMFSNAVVLVHT